MKKFKRSQGFIIILLFVYVLIMGFLISRAHAGDRSLTFLWEQTMSPGLTGWNLYKSESAGVYVEPPIVQIIYDGNPLNEYTSETSISSPDGETHLYYFVLTAFDDAEPDPNESPRSNEVSQVIDFEAPGTPFTLKVNITASP